MILLVLPTNAKEEVHGAPAFETERATVYQCRSDNEARLDHHYGGGWQAQAEDVNAKAQCQCSTDTKLDCCRLLLLMTTMIQGN